MTHGPYTIVIDGGDPEPVPTMTEAAEIAVRARGMGHTVEIYNREGERMSA